MLDGELGVANLFSSDYEQKFQHRRTPPSSTILPMLLFWALYLVLLLILALPVFHVARRRRRTTTIRNVAISAVVVGGLMAMTRYTSDRLVEQCIEVGNTQCIDAGSTGILWLFAIGFTVVVWARAWNLRGR